MKVVEEIKVIHDKSGFGIIHEVKVESGEHYARKTFRPNLQLSPQDHEMFKRRFAREVRIQEKLSSDYIIPIIYSDLEAKNPWFLMPIADKTYLEEIQNSRLAKKNPNGLSDILNCLEYLHSRGYTHRDIKPGNILFHEEKWKLADMGLITSDPELTTTFKTESGVALGSLPYMAPEQYTDFQNVTNKADIYSFGAILHDIFDGRSRKPYSKLTAKGSIGVIIEKCTEEDPENRFDDVVVLRNLLLSKLSKVEVSEELHDEAEYCSNLLKDYEKWDKETFDAFVTSLERNPKLKNPVLYDITIDFIEYSRSVNERHWKRFVKCYLNWIENTSFQFDYCDVLIGHIKTIYDICNDLSLQSDCIFVGAELAVSHNRWYCMRKVLEMTSPSIPDVLAERIAIEIYARSSAVKRNFIRCVEGLSTNTSRYHEEIRNALS